MPRVQGFLQMIERLLIFAALMVLAAIGQFDAVYIMLAYILAPLAMILVGLFQSRDNSKNAQLVFTTHDTTLLDSELLRRDQIWFVAKDSESSTRLYPLLDYSPRKDEALERGYLKGRYGAVPVVGAVRR